MQSNIDTLRAIIASRKSVFPTVYNDRKIERPVMEAVLESANFALATDSHSHGSLWFLKTIL